ncbi:FG-GAP-like repeat-containing protein [Streptomyces sp. NPDC048248]|uniref:FG-GAP-like repeat-containing protein n=1 Tax=Streptomyces sp. NPDC048248 TaxID=3365523 RepID=UPI00371D1423
MRRHVVLSVRRLRRRGVALAAVVAVVAGGTTVSGASAVDSPLPLRTDEVWGIDFAGGTLSTVERSASGDGYVMTRKIAPDGSTASARVPMAYADRYADGDHIKRVPCDAGSCVPLVGSGTGGVGVVFVDDGQERVQVRTGPDALQSFGEPAVTGARLVDMTGRYVAYEAQSTGKLYVDDVEKYRSTDVRMTRSRSAASVWGTQLWSAGTTAGAVTVTDLEQKKVVETLATGAPCAIKELQAVGRWVYWSCGSAGAAGVYDRTAKKSFAVPSGPAMAGDGYLVRHDRTAGKLLLTDFHTGASAAPRVIAELPAGTTADQRRLTWAVDKFGGDIAYVSPEAAVHVVPSGVPSQPLAKIESEVDDEAMDVEDSPWAATWQFSKPVTWTFTVKDEAGRTVRRLAGSASTEADVLWDGRTDAGTYAYNGMYSWALTATASEGPGTYGAGGKVGMSGGRQGHHDQGGHRYGELVTLNASGGLTLHFTEGKGVLNWKRSGSGWPAGSTAVPFGDMGSDRCAEMLVRMPGGELRRYAGKCGSAYTPAGSHASLGTGWNAYNVLTAPGDLTGDGRTDLLARKASTGDLYLFANNGNGTLASGRKIRSAWTSYSHIVGVGDLNGDGFGDVLARSKTGTLYRYDGTGSGTLRDRVTVFSDWGLSYNAIVGVGDLTSDGRNDLVVRDTAGNLYRNDGKGNGSFTSRTRIATGWQGYKGVF